MTRRVTNRSRRSWGRISFSFLLLFLLFLAATPVHAAVEPFPGYPEAVRLQSRRVVEAAGPGRGEALDREIRALRNVLIEHGILSVNEIPDRIFDRAVREKWKNRSYESLRATTRVAPLSISLWAWLAWEDAVRLRLEPFLADVDGLSGALRMYGPGVAGYAVWLVLFLSASAAWFAIWVSFNLLLRARPALTADLAHRFKGIPGSEIVATALVLACFVGPVLLGAGMGVAVLFWIALSSAYLRRGELVIAGMAIVLLTGVFLSGGFLHLVRPLAGEARQGSWMGGEGYFPRNWPDPKAAGGSLLGTPPWDRMVKFARARGEMQGGDLLKAEALWTELIREGVDLPAAYNNRGIVRVRLGRTEEGLSDFEAAVDRSREPGPAHWNAYQLYLQEFHLDQAARIQPGAWSGIRNFLPFDYRAEEMTHGELISSPMQLAEAWRNLFTVRLEQLLDLEGVGFHRNFFRPLSSKSIPMFLCAGLIWTVLWKLLARKIWMHSTCRACGDRTLVVRSRETSDICTSCRVQVGVGFRPGEERERRTTQISLHRRYARACSVLAPGAGALWAGKDFRTLVYGVCLCVPVGMFTVSWGAARVAGGLVGDMQTDVWRVALGAVTVLWLFGIAWSWRSFERLQLNHNLTGERR